MTSRAFVLFLLLAGVDGSATHAVEPRWRTAQAPVSNVEGACDSGESWVFPARLPSLAQKGVVDAGLGESNAFSALIVGHRLRYATQTEDPEVKALGDYLIYRGFLDLGIVHLAHRGFVAMLSGPAVPQTLGLRLAAFNCLTRIHARYPSMELPKGAALGVRGLEPSWLSRAQRKIFAEGILAAAAWKISEKGTHADLALEHQLLRGNRGHETLLLANEYAIRGQWAPAIQASERFLAMEDLSPSLLKQREGVTINLARLYFQAGQHDQAALMFKRVSQRSNLVSQALNDLAWNHLSRGDYTEATSAAFNLMSGELQHTFNPAAPVIAAISYFENCQYDEARRAVALFKRVYGKNYQWLYRWYQKNAQAPIGLYPLLAKFSEHRKGAPKQIAYEWLRSPVFISEQQEVNLALDERALVPHLLAEFARHPDYQPKKPASALPLFRGWLLGFLQELPRIEATLVARINRELTFRNRVMIAQFVEALDNVQLLEIELDSAAGERMLAKISVRDRKAVLEQAREEAADKHGERGSTLDWGRVPASEASEEENGQESWEDEIGAIRTDVLNLCKKSKKTK